MLTAYGKSVHELDEYAGRILAAGGARFRIVRPTWAGSSGNVDPYSWTEYEIESIDGRVNLRDDEGRYRKIACASGDRLYANRSYGGEFGAGRWEIMRDVDYWTARGTLEGES